MPLNYKVTVFRFTMIFNRVGILLTLFILFEIQVYLRGTSSEIWPFCTSLTDEENMPVNIIFSDFRLLSDVLILTHCLFVNTEQLYQRSDFMVGFNFFYIYVVWWYVLNEKLKKNGSVNHLYISCNICFRFPTSQWKDENEKVIQRYPSNKERDQSLLREVFNQVVKIIS